MNGFIRKHWVVFVIAFLVGLIVVLPTLRAIQKTENFQGIYPTFSDDESYYLSITKEVYDGGLSSGNTFLKEHKIDLPMQPLFFEILPAYEAKILNLSIPATFALNDFLLPFLGILLLYFLFFSITKNKILANIFSTSFYLVFLASMGRPISPQLGIVFFFIATTLVWKILQGGHSLKKLILLNLSLAAAFSFLVYIYPFYWTAVLALYITSSVLIMFFENNFIYWFKNYLFFGIASAVFLTPYALSTLKLTKSLYFLESSVRNGLVFSHSPGAFISVGFLIICLPIIYILSPYFKEKRELLFCYATILCGVALNWQNIFTGKILQFSSHYYITTIFFIFLIFSVIIKNIWQNQAEINLPKYKKYSALALTCLLAVVILYKQENEMVSPFKNIISPKDISSEQDMMSTFTWLNKNTPPESVVYALGDEYNTLIPVYTQNNVYNNWYGGMSLVSDSEMEDRWIIGNFWNNIDSTLVEESQRSIWINRFQDTYAHKEVMRKILGVITRKQYEPNTLVDQSAIDIVLNKYKKFKSEGFEKALKTYAVDYVLLDLRDEKYSRLESKLKFYPFLVSEIKTDTFEIFKVN